MSTLIDRAAPAARPVAPVAPTSRRARRPLPRRSRGERWALLVLLAAAAALYLVGIGGSGWANTYYTAAAQAGAQSWHALLYGASDAPASITVDKPPASLWLMGLSVRLLGLTPVAIVLPQALLGVATVATVHASVRRLASAPAALLAGAIVATMPVATLMFRYDNPDALLTALVALAAYATVRAVQEDRLRWPLLVGAAFGLGFLTKQLPAFLTLPGMGLGFLLAGPGGVLHRVRSLLVAGAAMVVAGGWWVALVELVPAAARPYVGGSTTNSFLQLTFGYNGMGRIMGGSGNGAGRASDAARLITDASGQGVAWLLPAAVLLAVAALVAGRRAPRTDAVRALLIGSLIGLVLTVVAFSMMSGIYHSYYCVVMVPQIALLVAVGTAELWRRRARASARAVLALALLVTAGWTAHLLVQSPPALLGLAVPVVILAVAAALLLVVRSPGRAVRGVTAGLAVAAVLAAPLAISLATAATPHAGSGPIVAHGTQQTVTADPQVVALLERSGAADGTAAAPAWQWEAATQGSRVAAAYQLDSGLPVMPIGGYTRTDPSPTLAQFQGWVREGRVHWYIGDQGTIGTWVAAHYPAQQVGGAVVYDLSAPPSAP